MIILIKIIILYILSESFPGCQSTTISGCPMCPLTWDLLSPLKPRPTQVLKDVTIAIQGFHIVKASIMWDTSVVATAHRTQRMFFPVLSTRSPNTGDMGADMT